MWYDFTFSLIRLSIIREARARGGGMKGLLSAGRTDCASMYRLRFLCRTVIETATKKATASIVCASYCAFVEVY